jgi:3-deoxy-7-phosphoheptulonate synthase
MTAEAGQPHRVLKVAGAPLHRVRLAADLHVGTGDFVVIAGPCAVESVEQVEKAAASVRAAGAHALRGGVFKPRTSPYSFQGMGEPGLKILSDAAKRHRLPIVSEVMDGAQLPLMLDYVDVLQVGARNMQNFSLLRAVSKVDRPVLLKRGLAATLEEWLLAAEYILDGGNSQVILCERGIRTFEPALRNTLDLGGVAWMKQRCKLPVLVDPSHATGDRALVTPMVLAAAAAGADGVLVEVHPTPEHALCDGHQALTPDMFLEMMKTLPAVLKAVGKTLYGHGAPQPLRVGA